MSKVLAAEIRAGNLLGDIVSNTREAINKGGIPNLKGNMEKLIDATSTLENGIKDAFLQDENKTEKYLEPYDTLNATFKDIKTQLEKLETLVFPLEGDGPKVTEAKKTMTELRNTYDVMSFRLDRLSAMIGFLSVSKDSRDNEKNLRQGNLEAFMEAEQHTQKLFTKPSFNTIFNNTDIRQSKSMFFSPNDQAKIKKLMQKYAPPAVELSPRGPEPFIYDTQGTKEAMKKYWEERAKQKGIDPNISKGTIETTHTNTPKTPKIGLRKG